MMLEVQATVCYATIMYETIRCMHGASSIWALIELDSSTQGKMMLLLYSEACLISWGMS